MDIKVINVQLFQFNSHKSRVGINCLSSYLLDHNITSFICLLQEPYVFKGRVAGMPSSSIVFSVPGTKDNPTRAAIWASPDLNIVFNPELSDPDTATVTWVDANGVLRQICSVYCDILKDSINDTLKDAVSNANHLSRPNIIGLDTNAHSGLWGSEDENQRGREFEDFILQNDLLVANEGSEPTYHCATGKSVIDVTLANDLSFPGIRNWRILDEDFASDHK